MVYIEDSISSVLDQNNINNYSVPINPYQLGLFNDHMYGNLVPTDVNQQIEKENSALAKEIEDQRNDKIV